MVIQHLKMLYRPFYFETVNYMGRLTANQILEGKTLEAILKELVDYLGWEELGKEINIKCFNEDPSIKSSLIFLRRTPWARSKVEWLYVQCMRKKNSLM